MTPIEPSLPWDDAVHDGRMNVGVDRRDSDDQVVMQTESCFRARLLHHGQRDRPGTAFGDTRGDYGDVARLHWQW